MTKQKAPPAKQESKTGKHGDFYVSVISKKDGSRTITEHIESKEEAMDLAKEKGGKNAHTHAYEFRNGEYESIFTTVPKNKEN